MIDVLVPTDRRVRVAGPWRFIREMPGARCDRSSGAPSRLWPATAALDLANATRRAGEVVGLITSVTQQRLTRPERILEELAQRRVHQHRSLIEGVLEDVRGEWSRPWSTATCTTAGLLGHEAWDASGHEPGQPARPERAPTLRYGWFDVADRPCGVAWQVYWALVQRGYTGPFRRC